MARAERANSLESTDDVNRKRSYVWSLAVTLGVSLAAGQTCLAGGSDAPTSAPAGPAGAAGAASPAPVRDLADVERMLRDLAHPQFKVRTAATAALNDIDHRHLPLLVEAYARQRDHETKLRLRSAAEHAFYRKQLDGRLGFLGLQPQPQPLVYDPVLGKTVEAIYLTRVLADFPAEAAGVKTGDFMLEFDGRPVGEIMGAARPQQFVRQPNNGALRLMLPSTMQIEAFTNEVSQREPGSRVPMRLLRADAVDRELKLTISDRPVRTLDGASLVTAGVPQTQVPFNQMVGPPVRHGLVVTAVAAQSPAATAGLKPGDVIVGIKRMPFGPNVTPEQLQELFGTLEPRSVTVLTLSRVEQIQVTVTLGGRPVDRMNPGDMEIAQARFAEWWREQTGESSLRGGASSTNSAVPRSPRALPDPTVLP